MGEDKMLSAEELAEMRATVAHVLDRAHGATESARAWAATAQALLGHISAQSAAIKAGEEKNAEMRAVGLHVNADEIAAILSEYDVDSDRISYIAVRIADAFDPPTPPQWDAATVARLVKGLDGLTGLTHVAERDLAMVKAAIALGEERAEKRLRTLLEAPTDEVVNAVADAIQKEGETYAIIPGYAYARLARAALSALNKAGLET